MFKRIFLVQMSRRQRKEEETEERKEEEEKVLPEEENGQIHVFFQYLINFQKTKNPEE
jgi:hypothetical protein